MHTQSQSRKQLVKRIFVYALMFIAVITIVTAVTLLMLGYRIDFNNGSLRQDAFLQFSSVPSGATVSIDGKVTTSKTPNKATVVAGKHDVRMWRDGYEIWSKSVDVKAGTLTWLNYALLVPKKLTVQSIEKYDSISTTLASPKGNYMLVGLNRNKPTFDLVELSQDKTKSSSLTIPASVYSDATTVGVSHEFTATKWDDGERYVLLQHVYGLKTEWIVMDTQNVSASKNISKTFDIGIGKIVFSGTSGNKFYALDTTDVRSLDLGAGTMSKPIISNVTDFNFYDESKVITYVGGNGDTNSPKLVAGVYREGDDKSSVIRSVPTSLGIQLRIATTHYFNEDYVAIGEGNKIDVLSGSYPNTTSDNANTMKLFTSFTAGDGSGDLAFSPTGEYLFLQSGASFTSYDLEYRGLVSSTVSGTGALSRLKWLDNNHIWSDRDGKLQIVEFDGANTHTINSVVQGQDATLTNNGRFLYSIGKSGAGYQLQRVRMILP